MQWKVSDMSHLPPDTSPGQADKLFTDNLQLLDYMAPSVWRNLVIYTSGATVVSACGPRPAPSSSNRSRACSTSVNWGASSTRVGA